MYKNYTFLNAIFLFFGMTAQLTFGQVKTTITNGNWDDPAIWSPTGVPDIYSTLDTLIINHNVNYESTIRISHFVKIFRVNEDKSLLPSTDSDSLIIASKIYNSGTMSAKVAAFSDTTFNNGNLTIHHLTVPRLENYHEIEVDSIILTYCYNTGVIDIENVFISGGFLFNSGRINSNGWMFLGTDSKNENYIYSEKRLVFGDSLYNSIDGYIETNDTLLNNNYCDNAGQIVVKSILQTGHLTGDLGRVCIAENYQNFGVIDGSIDVCDATPDGTFDFVYGSVGSDVTMCEVSSCREITTEIMESSSSLEISVYPNPARDNFQITITNQTMPLTFVLYDIKGSEIVNTDIVNGQLIVNRNSIPSGIYYYQIKGEKEITFGKVSFM